MILGPGGIGGGAFGTNLEVEVDCAVVVTLSWEVTAPPLGVTAAGENMHDTPCGNKEALGQLKATGWLKLLTGATVTV
jgi:hypothetical protein